MPDKYNEVLMVILVGTILFFVLIIILVRTFLFYQKKKNNHAKQLIQIEKTFSEMLFQSKLEIQEETFKKISEEIHDNIQQVLTLVKLNLSTMNLPEEETDKAKLLQAKTLLKKSIQDLRDIARSINTDFIQQAGFVNSVEQQLKLLEKTGAYTTRFTITGGLPPPKPQQELILFRVIQELLNNIVKHAQANSVHISIACLPEKMNIVIEDNGKGFDIGSLDSRGEKGLGLKNMFNRIQFIGGVLTLQSEPLKGTKAIIELPLK